MRPPDREYEIGKCLRFEWWDDGFKHAEIHHVMTCRGHDLEVLDTTQAMAWHLGKLLTPAPK